MKNINIFDYPYFANMDALNFLKQLDTNSVDFILTDPPYLISEEISTIRRSNDLKYKWKDIDFKKWTDWDRVWENKNEYRTHILDIETTKEINSSLLKEVSGEIRLNYKNGKIAFGFVDDYYIPGFLLEKSNIEDDDYVFVKMIFNPKEPIKKQWKVFEIEKLD